MTLHHCQSITSPTTSNACFFLFAVILAWRAGWSVPLPASVLGGCIMGLALKLWWRLHGLHRQTQLQHTLHDTQCHPSEVGTWHPTAMRALGF